MLLAGRNILKGDLQQRATKLANNQKVLMGYAYTS